MGPLLTFDVDYYYHLGLVPPPFIKTNSCSSAKVPKGEGNHVEEGCSLICAQMCLPFLNHLSVAMINMLFFIFKHVIVAVDKPTASYG